MYYKLLCGVFTKKNILLFFYFQGCRHHTTGDYCDRCENGYVGNATNGECTYGGNIMCDCNTDGSVSEGK